MSDSSEDEDLSRFRDFVDTSFTKLINESRGLTQADNENIQVGASGTRFVIENNENYKINSSSKQKSERYLEEATHYNDVKVPPEMQKRIGAKISAIIQRNVEFVDFDNPIKKRKIKGGVKLFKDSEGYLTSEEAKDTYTEHHNIESRKLKKKRRQIDMDMNLLNEEDKVTAVTVSGDYILSKDDTKCWKSRRKEKLSKYKGQGKNKVLTAVD